MRLFPSWMWIAPLLCVGVILILTLLVLFIAVRQAKRVIDQQTDLVESSASANNRWARADLKGESRVSQIKPTLRTCRACGGENPAHMNICQYCGRQL